MNAQVGGRIALGFVGRACFYHHLDEEILIMMMISATYKRLKDVPNFPNLTFISMTFIITFIFQSTMMQVCCLIEQHLQSRLNHSQCVEG